MKALPKTQDLYRTVIEIAAAAHAGQVDKMGVPYICHPARVASEFNETYRVCTAWLHDVVEDSDWQFTELEDAGVPFSVISALTLLTHDKKVSYTDYIKTLAHSGNAIAIDVKIADLKDNLDESRGEIDSSLRERYQWAYDYLKEAQTHWL